MKVCPKCKIEKKRVYFDIDRRAANGLTSWCRDCHYAGNRAVDERLRMYSITRKEYEKMCKDQKYKCLICLRKTKLYIDHDHKTLAIRGLLCNNCNLSLGHFKDNSEWLRRAADYLDNAPKKMSFKRMFMAL